MSTLEERIRERAERASRRNAGATIIATTGNADVAARANAISRRLGIPADVVERNIVEMEQRDRARQNVQVVHQASPYVQGWFADPRNAAAGQEDVRSLADLGRVGALWEPGRGPVQYQPVLPSGPRRVVTDRGAVENQTSISMPQQPQPTLWNYVRGVWNNVTQGSALSLEGTRMFVRDMFGLGGSEQVIDPETGGWRYANETELEGMRQSVLRGSASRIAQAQAEIARLDPGFKTATARAIYGGVSSFAQTLPGLVASALTRSPVPMLTVAGGQVGTEAYGRYRSRGATANEALLGAVGEGGVEALTELIPTAKFLGAMVPGSSFFKEMGKSILADIPGEQIATLAQDALDTAIANPDASWAQYWADRPQAAFDTLIATLTQGVITGGLGGVGRLAARRMEAQVAGNILDGVMERAATTKLRETDPEAFQRFVEGAFQGTPVENVYLPAEAVRELMQDGIETHPFWSRFAEQIKEAEALQGDVVIPLAEVATHLAGTPEWETLRPEARLSPGGASEAELQAQSEEQRETVGERVSAQAAKVAEQTMPVANVFADYYRQFIGLGHLPQAAEKYATIWALNREAQAKRLGVPVEQYHAENPVEFRRVLPERLAEMAAREERLDAVVAELKEPGATVASIATRQKIEEAAADLRSILEAQGIDPETATKREIKAAIRRQQKEGSDGRGLEQPRDGRAGGAAGSLAPLEGAPVVQGVTGPDPNLVAVAESYAREAGIPLARQAEYVEINPKFSKSIADAYEAMEHAPNDPAVKAAYADLIRQTRAQYDALVAAGYTFSFFDDDTDPYSGNPWNAMRDLRENKHMAVYSTAEGFGSDETVDVSNNPLLANTGLTWPDPEGVERPVLANDLFRAVHDAFGHGLEGAGFRARGEENAWQAHSRLFTGPALAALTTETRGQNSWLNFGPYGEANQTAKLEDTVFADQKTGLMPDWTWTEGRAADEGTVVVDDDGAPKLLFHGTPFEFERFRTAGGAIWFSEDEGLAKRYAEGRRVRKLGSGPIINARLYIKNPLTIRPYSEDGRSNWTADSVRWAQEEYGLDLSDFGYERHGSNYTHDIVRTAAFADAARAAGYDAIKQEEGGHVTWGVLERGAVIASDKRVLYQDPFYSALERAVEAIKTNRAPAQQWLATLKKAPGVKAEELEWTGLEEWLQDQTAPVEKEAVLEVLRAGAVTVEERVLGEVNEDAIEEEERQRIEEEFIERGYFYDSYEPRYSVEEVTEDEDGNELDEPKWKVIDAWDSFNVPDAEPGEVLRPKLYDDEDTAHEVADELDMEVRDEAELEARRAYVEENLDVEDLRTTDAEYPSYSLASDDPVGMGYRELLIHFPWGNAEDFDGRRRSGTQVGKAVVDAPSTHWSAESGVVAHARFHDRKGPNGERILFVDEIQSDWHQQGRTRGYATPADPATVAKAEQASEDADKALDAVRAERDRVRDSLTPKVLAYAERFLDESVAKSREVIDQQYAAKLAENPGTPDLRDDEERRIREVADGQMYRLSALQRETGGGGTVGKGTMRQALDAIKRHANGTGETLPQEFEFEAAEYDRLEDEFRQAWELARLRGEEARIAREGGDIPDAPFKTTWPMLVMKRLIVWAAEGGYDQIAWIKEGENNGGMSDKVGWFYEKVLPNETNKLLKKYGAKVRPVTVNGLAKMPSPREAELRERMKELDRETRGVARQVGELDVVRLRWQEARDSIEKRIKVRQDTADKLQEDISRINAMPEEQRMEQPNLGDLVFAQRRLNETNADIAAYRDILAETADFEEAWAKNREYWALEQQAQDLADQSGTNLGFDITPELREAASEGFALFQGGKRGRVSGGIIGNRPGTTLIEVFDEADLSTVIHETGHVFVEELYRNASLPDAPKDIVEDWTVLADWFEANGFPVTDGVIPVEAHELAARGFERYMMEGKAPTGALQRMFDAFRGWLLTIYKHVRNLRSPITPEVRRVFDRMLVTQEAIDEAADTAGIEARFQNAEQAGMTEAEFTAYRQMADQARSEAFDALLYKTMAGIRAERTKAARAEKARLREEATRAVNAQPMFRAIHLLRTGRFLDDPEREPVKVKLDRAWLVERYGEDVFDRLPKGAPIYAENADDPETVANLAGFKSAAEMIDALIELETARLAMRENGDRRSVKARLIAERVDEQFDDKLDDGQIEEEALAAIHNDRQGELIAAEHRALGRQRGNEAQTLPYAMVREWARRKIAEGRVADVASRAAIQRYARAQAKAARAFEKALAEGNTEEAFNQAEIRLLNHALASEAGKAAARVETAVDRLSKTARQRKRKTVDQEYFDRALALLEKFEFRPRSQRQLDEAENFAAWAQRQADNGVDVITPPRLEDTGVHYTRMSVEELIGLDDSVTQLLHLGRRKKRLLDAAEKREFDEIVAEAVATVEDIPQKASNNRLNPSRFDRLKAGIASIDAALLKMEQVFDWLDAGNPNGMFNRHVFKPLADAQDREARMVEDYLGQVRDLMRALPKEVVKRWTDKFSDPRLLNREKGQPFQMTRQDLVSIALNVGNEGNFDKLAGGYGWNRETIMDVLDRELSAEEWQFVQSAWDLVNTLWPEIEALEKRVNGVAPEKVEPRAFTLSNGTTLRGGYYPVVYDPMRNYQTEAIQGVETSKLFGSGYQRATTRQGFTKERTSVERPIKLSLSVLNRHLTEVIHDITHREAIIQADRFLSDRRVMKAVDDAVGPEIRKQFRPWLSYVANEWAVELRGLDGIETLGRKLRTHSTIIGMGFRLSTIIAQTAGYAGIAEKVGTRWLASGFKAVGRDPVGTYDFVMERSKEVRHRMSTMERDMNANIRELQGKFGVLANARRFAFHGIGYMDRAVTIPAWIGSYHKGMREGMSEDEAAYFADKVIRETQGAGGAKDLTRVQRGNEFLRLATMFYSYAAAFYNRQRDLFRSAKQARKPGEFAAVLARAWWLLVISPIMGQLPGVLLGGYGPDEDDDETWAGWMVATITGNLFYGIPLVRDVATAAATGFDYQFTPASRLFDTLIRSGGDVWSMLDGDEETEPGSRAVKTGVESVGYVARLPVGQISNAAQFLVDWASGEADPDGVGDWLTGLQRGKLEE